ncbi:MAG TPA: twin-arginine translocase TatA/TatE family subunit [Gaiellaceae bacterium]|jgi:sec-independent protein translocase protein TatA|nr:twin-arginine translocase TatA/TatE family subunit [Gaiellaceae bacterium]
MGFDLITPMHLLFLAILGLLLFGPKRLPDMGRSLGMGIREFKSTITGSDGVAGAVAQAVELQPAPPVETGTDSTG